MVSPQLGGVGAERAAPQPYEPANIGPLRELANIVSSGRGQGILVASVSQDLSQIKVYGHGAEEVKPTTSRSCT